MLSTIAPSPLRFVPLAYQRQFVEDTASYYRKLGAGMHPLVYIQRAVPNIPDAMQLTLGNYHWYIVSCVCHDAKDVSAWERIGQVPKEHMRQLMEKYFAPEYSAYMDLYITDTLNVLNRTGLTYRMPNNQEGAWTICNPVTVGVW